MKVVSSPQFDIQLGWLRFLHPFDGMKFSAVREALRETTGLDFVAPSAPIPVEAIDQFVDPLMRRLLRGRRYPLQALEVPALPGLSRAFIEQRVLLPMRWGVAGTLLAAEWALQGQSARNLAGGYHHASRHAAEGFCLYNDIGIAVDQLRQRGALSAQDRLLVIDVDAHHGNGNADVFMDRPEVTLLDVFNAERYPQSPWTRERVDLAVPLPEGCDGVRYLQALDEAMASLRPGYRLAFVVAGTDVLASDPLGGLRLSVADCAERDRRIARRLAELGLVPAWLGGGGYGPESRAAMVEGIQRSRPQALDLEAAATAISLSGR